MKPLLATLAILLFAVLANAQHTHSGDIQGWKLVRVYPKAKITFYDGKKLEYVLQDAKETEVGSLEITKDTILPKDFAKDYEKGLWWLIWCSEHSILYRVERFQDGQIPKK